MQSDDNPSKKRNDGAKKSKTELIAFINGHTILADNWYDETKKFFSQHPDVDIVGGPQLTSKDDSLFERASGYALSSVLGSANVGGRYKPRGLNLNADETHLTSANLICKRELFKKVKFDESIYPGEDPKFISDAKNAGLKIAYSPEIVVYNKRRKDLKGLFKQIFNYGKVRTQKESLKETLKKPFFIVPSLFVIYMAFLPFLSFVHFLFLAPLFLYIFLCIVFGLYESLKNRELRSIFMVASIFVTIHISYGLGMLYGLVKNRIVK